MTEKDDDMEVLRQLHAGIHEIRKELARAKERMGMLNNSDSYEEIGKRIELVYMALDKYNIAIATEAGLLSISKKDAAALR